MTQLARLISLLTLLKSKRLLNSTEIANRFNVSVRTVYRDIKKLEEAGVPVVTIEGRGYTLMDGYTVSPVQFTQKEANALVTASHLVQQSKDASFKQDFDDALTKIQSVFRTSILEKSEILKKNIYVFKGWDEDLSSNTLAEIQLAITNFHFIEIHYQKINHQDISQRKVEPVALYSSQNKWILVGWCHLRKDYRAFRVDRIRAFSLLPDKFENRQFSLQRFFEEDVYKGKK
ncbi:MAG: YafY family transcriptional regulator [Schleiferiaceae bacterium]|nr:YafY family transcriptional regulator [Schleiferiaceae bacterium]